MPLEYCILALHSHSPVDRTCVDGVLHISNTGEALCSAAVLLDFLLLLWLAASHLGMDASVDSRS